MHSAAAVLTERGGMTSHAAVIARGLGLPCVVGASEVRLDARDKKLTTADGRVFREGDVVTLDGSKGEALAGAAEMLPPALDDSFRRLLAWADEVRDIGIRANADTPADAETARKFEAQGIGLCRTEHMFFEEDRLVVMREMIFADTPRRPAAALARLLPMQRADFVQLFEIMQGLPVCIRLFDPPLHEFLPQDREGLRDLAEALDRPLSEVTRRAEALTEVNPMLGMRGVRLGVVLPEIYDMQAQAIFEATLESRPPGRAGGARDHDPAGQRPARGGTGQDPDRRGGRDGPHQGRARASTTSWASWSKPRARRCGRARSPSTRPSCPSAPTT
jgi:pyruvate, orthophosphate dikinase